MVAANYSDLLIHIKPGHGIPPGFFESCDDTLSSIFLVSCLNNETIIYIDDSFEVLTGYPAKTLVDRGLSFLFPLIHPDDMAAVTASIKKSHEDLATPEFPRPFPPMVLEYRFKTRTGEWLRIRETKYLLLEGSDAMVDKVLCKMEMADDDKRSCSKLLDFALAYDEKIRTSGSAQAVAGKSLSAATPALTKREHEILSLIGKGLSTKMIADKCNISINTVETHRRHLLEKLNVKNSMELIKEASRIFLLD